MSAGNRALSHQPTRNNKVSRSDGLVRRSIEERKRKHERKGLHMKATTPMRIRVNRFLTDRHEYRDRANYLPELVIFGLVVIAAIWPILSLATILARVR